MKTPEILKRIAAEIERVGGKAFLVGGAVRDHLMGWESKDLDVEVFGLSLRRLKETLGRFGYVRRVGKAFGVLKLFAGEEDFDFSLPRRDIKTGAGHKGFRVTTDPRMSFRQAASRRDFTVNAMGMDIMKGRIIDEFGGREDLKNRILRVVDPATFVEDPLRVLRGIQFAARFQFDVPPDTLRLFRRLVPSLKELPKERIFEELKKLLLKAERPSAGFQLAEQAEALETLFPEQRALRGLRGKNARDHILKVIDEAAELRNGDESHDIRLMLGAVCHDLDTESARRFLKSLTEETKLTNAVLELIKELRQPDSLYRISRAEDGGIRRLALRVNISLLLKLAKADYLAGLTNDENRRFPAGERLEKRFRDLGLNDDQKIAPLLMGRHLIKLGLNPGPRFGMILKEAFELQLDGKISDETQAVEWAGKKTGKK